MKSLAAVAVVIVIWAAGLMAFADRAARAEPPADPPKADVVVVLTGASDARIAKGVELLLAGKGDRLLISGVDRSVDRKQFREIIEVPAAVYDCCVILGFDAENTVGNAQEIAAWSRSKNFKTLIVVTSDYHMARSLLEIRSALPEAELIAYPIRTPLVDSSAWWKSGTGVRRMSVEYSKYLVVLVREALIGGGRSGRDEAAETAPA